MPENEEPDAPEIVEPAEPTNSELVRRIEALERRANPRDRFPDVHFKDLDDGDSK